MRDVSLVFLGCLDARISEPLLFSRLAGFLTFSGSLISGLLYFRIVDYFSGLLSHFPQFLWFIKGVGFICIVILVLISVSYSFLCL